MKPFIRWFAVIALLLSQQTFATEVLSATLEANKVVRDDNGKEQLRSAEKARPGDVLEYRAHYKNNSAKPLRGVIATLPVPATGMEYLLDTSSPGGAEASVDGVNFAPPPLKRRVRLPDGTQRQQLVPTSEYRFLRWSLGDVPAGATRSVTARMRVIAEPVPTSTP